MKKNRKIVLWILLLVLLGAVFAGLKIKNSSESETSADSEEDDTITLTDIDSDSVCAVSFQLNGEEVSFSKENDSWSWDQDQEFPLNGSKVGSIAVLLSNVTANRVIEGDTVNPEEYGIDEPSNVVTITQDDGTEMIFTVGTQNTTSYQWYICMNNDTSKVYMVSTAFGTMFPDEMLEWAESEELPSIEDENITCVEVDGDNGYKVSVDPSNALWSAQDHEGRVHDADDESVATLISAAAALSYDDLVSYQCDDFAAYGLESPLFTIRIDYTEEQETEADDEETDESSESESEEETKTVTVNKSLTLLVGGQDEEGNYYVTTEDSKEVHTISSGKVEAITGINPVDLYDMYIGMLNVADLKSLDITIKGETKTVSRHVEIEESDDEDSSESEVVSYLCDGAELDKTAFTTFYSSAIGMKAQTKDYSLEASSDAEISLVFHMQDQDYTVEYSPYDSSFYFTNDIQGVPSLVNKNSVKTMIENYENLFE